MKLIKGLIHRSIFLIGGLILAIPALTWAAEDQAGTEATRVPTLLPTSDITVGGDSRYCVGLARLIQSGEIHLWNIPCFIKFFSETLIAFAGTLSVLFVMYGGFRYVVSGYTEDKDSAKKTIEYALLGLAVSLMAWIIVDVALQIATE